MGIISYNDEEGFILNDIPSFFIERPAQLYERRDLIGACSGMKIHQYGNEGIVPHFHISINGKPDACLMLETNKWFIHGKHTSTLSHKELKNLVLFLNSKNKNGDYTNWEYMVKLWNQDFPNNMIKEDISIPDYLNMQ